MQLLRTEIMHHLRRNPYYVLLEADVVRLWPVRKDRDVLIRMFAEKHQWHLVNYVEGYGAIFAKNHGRAAKRKIASSPASRTITDQPSAAA